MKKVLKLMRTSCLYILLLPYAIFGLGAASNQAVLISNHDKFPVMLNARKLNKIMSQSTEDKLLTMLGIPKKVLPAPDSDGMIDDVHCQMTKNTHLNALADVFDLGSIYSIGDFALYTGEWLMGWTPFVWATTLIGRAYRNEP